MPTTSGPDHSGKVTAADIVGGLDTLTREVKSLRFELAESRKAPVLARPVYTIWRGVFYGLIAWSILAALFSIFEPQIRKWVGTIEIVERVTR